MDIADEAQLHDEAVAHEIARTRARAQQMEVLATGFCLNCETPVRPGVRWCDAECREDWEMRRPRK